MSNKASQHKSSRAVLYRVSRTIDLVDIGGKHEEQSKTIFEHQEAARIDTLFAAVNGLCKDEAQAACSILPPMIDYAYRSRDWYREYSSPYDISHDYSLFFIPKAEQVKRSTLNVDGLTPVQLQTIQKLAELILDAQERKQKVLWTIHGSGVFTFAAAIKQLQGKNLDCHSVMFMAPRVNLSEVFPLLIASNIKLSGDVHKYHPYDVLSIFAQKPGKDVVENLKNLDVESLKAEVYAATVFEDKKSIWYKPFTMSIKAIAAVVLVNTAISTTENAYAYWVFAVCAAILACLDAIPFSRTLGYLLCSLRESNNINKNPHLNPSLSATELRILRRK